MHFSKIFLYILAGLALLAAPSSRLLSQSAYQRIVISDAVSAMAADADGDLLVIGDPHAADFKGMAAVYDLKTNTRLRELLPDDTGYSNDFGSSVAIGDGYVVVGDSDYWSVDFSDTPGAAYVYDVHTGELLHLIRPIGHGRIRDFGDHMAIDNGRLLISSRGSNHPEIRGFRAAAWLFDLQTGELIREFPYVQAGSSYGASVELKGDLAIVGAPDYRPNPADYLTVTGAVHVFDVDTGEEILRLQGSLEELSTGFGSSLLLGRSGLFVGAPFYDGSSESGTAEYSGRAHLVNVETGELLRTYYPTSPTGFLYFGESLAIQGNTLLVGSSQVGPYQSTFDTWPAGRAFLFDISTAALIMELQPVERQNGDLFGQSVVLEGDRAIVTARKLDPDSSSRGLLYIYDLSDADRDGLGYAAELANGTDPANPDSDNDGLFDGPEVSHHLDPNGADSVPEGLADACLETLILQAGEIKLGSLQLQVPTVFPQNSLLELQFQLFSSPDLIHFSPLEDPFVISVPAPAQGPAFYRLTVEP